MNVANYSYWSADWLHVALLDQKLLDLLAQHPQFSLIKDLPLPELVEPLFRVSSRDLGLGAEWMHAASLNTD